MNEFFLNNSLCLSTYLLIIVLLMGSIVLQRFKKYFLSLALALYVFDITYLMILGFQLQRCAIVTGICVILVLFSIKEGRNYEL